MDRLTHFKNAACWITCFASLLMWSCRVCAQGYGPGPGPMNPAGASQPFSVAVAPGIPGSVWISATGANKGLGYDDSYYSLGGKRRLFEGPLEGRWLGEVHAHVTHEEGKPFANFGLERVGTFTPTGANIGFSVWFDIDDDRNEVFNHTFAQVGVGTTIKTQLFDFRANGYIPVGDDDFTLAPSCFQDHNIVSFAGFDRALEGFDTEVRVRPSRWSFFHGFVDVGGYAYKSGLVDAFGGIRTRLGFEPIPGIQLSAEVNRDSEFDTTGFLRLTIALGGQDRAHGEYNLIARDLERTVRNDHIVRSRRPSTLLIDPDTGLPYRVHHVDNTAAAGGDGSVNDPHDTLLDAEVASGSDDIIFVREGDGTATGMNAGILLQDGQLFLGDGVEHLIPTVGGGTFTLCNDIDGNKPTITNQANLDVVTLANRNTVAGFNINGFNAADHGVFGTGVTDTIIRDNMMMDLTGSGVLLTGASGTLTIRDNMIATTGAGSDAIAVTGMVGTGNTLLVTGNDIDDPGGDGISVSGSAGENTVTVSSNTIDAVALAAFTGNGIFIDTISDDVAGTGGIWTISDNIIGEALLNGLLVSDFLDAEAETTVSGNTASNSGIDGMHFERFDGSFHLFTANTTDENADDGIELVDYVGASADIDINLHTSMTNMDDGIAVTMGNGDLTIFSSTSSSNVGNGVDINNFTNDVSGTNTVISSSVINDNGAGIDSGINYFLDVPSMPLMVPPNLGETFTVTNSTISGNGVNILVDATEDGTLLTTNLTENIITNFFIDGVDLRTRRGAAQTINVAENSSISGTAASTGVALRILVDDELTGVLTTLTGTISGNTISNPGGAGAGVGIASGVDLTVRAESNLDLTFENNDLNVGDGIGFLADFSVANTMVNNLELTNNRFDGSTGADDSVVIRSLDDTRLDVYVRLNEFQNSARDAFVMDLRNTSMNRVLVESNQFIDGSGTSASLGAIVMTTINTTQLFATVRSNTIRDHGGNGGLTNASNVIDPFWSPSVRATASSTSNMSLRFDDNFISRSALEAIVIEALGGANIDALVINNRLENNDRALAFMAGFPSAKPAGRRDFRATKNAGSTMCLALHNNIGDTGIGFLVESGGAPSLDFEEGTNSQTATVTGDVTTTVFDPVTSTCIMNIETDAAAYTPGAGFPPPALP